MNENKRMEDNENKVSKEEFVVSSGNHMHGSLGNPTKDTWEHRQTEMHIQVKIKWIT